MEDMMIKCTVKEYYENNGLLILLKYLKTKIKKVNADIETHNAPRKGMFAQLYYTLAHIPPVVRAWLLGFWGPSENPCITES
jgi:hypothetical protein